MSTLAKLAALRQQRENRKEQEPEPAPEPVPLPAAEPATAAYNADLKRDLAPYLERAQLDTQRALAKLVHEKLAATIDDE